MKPISTNPQGEKTVKDLLRYLTEYGQSKPGLGIDRNEDPDLRENRARRVTEMDPPSPASKGKILKYQNGGVTPTDPKKLKKGIAWVESNDNYSAMNTESTATGKYQQLHSMLSNQPEMTYEGVDDYGRESSNLVSRDSLANNPALQETFMDRSIHEGIGGRSLLRHGRELTQEYQGQLGDKWNFREDEVAALSHFIGREGTRNYFKSILNNTPFSIPGTNHTAEMYLEKYNEGINRD